MQNNGGIIVSMDGIQPDKGNETIYLVRDALTGRVLAAENVTFSGTAVLKELLAPVAELEGTVLGTISDAQETVIQALEQMWPDVPHQVCQFHALRDAAQSAYEVDRKIKTEMCKYLHPRLKDVRQEITRRLPKASPQETEQLAVLTRLAFADMLLEQGMPVSLILDDPLVYSDDGRLDLMTEILEEASQRMQVILLTCRDRAFRHLDATRVQI